MGKKIIITAGPTNERIDSVMQITNMSTGALGCRIAEALLSKPAYFDQIDKVYYVSAKLAYKPENRWDSKLELIQIQSADDLLDVLTRLLTTEHIDAVIQNAAVGDYKAKYSVRGEALAEEITKTVLNMPHSAAGFTQNSVYEAVLRVLDSPECAADDSGKMSSYEPHLITMMTLTPKVIGQIKKLSPRTMLIGSKLLDGVSKQELFDVASRLRQKTNADYIIANDLSLIRDGCHPAMIIGYDYAQDRDAIAAECKTKNEIAKTVAELIFTDLMPITDMNV